LINIHYYDNILFMINKNQKLIFLLLIINLFSCKNMHNTNAAFAEFDKYIVYFNYSAGEICLFDTETSSIDKKYQLNIDSIQKYAINRNGFSYNWYYNNDDTNVYLMEGYSKDSRENRYTRIYKIDMERFEISEIYYSDKDLNEFCIIGNDLYLMSYVEPHYGIMNNKEKNYIILYNFMNKTEKIINFNESLSENDKICAPYFRVSGNKIIMTGWIDDISQKKLYEYDMETKTITIIADGVNKFFINNDTVIYNTKRNKKVGLVVYDLIKSTYKILPEVKETCLDYFVVDENIIIYALENITARSFLDYFWIFPSSKTDRNYYISEIKTSNRKFLFNNKNEIEILGIMNKR